MKKVYLILTHSGSIPSKLIKYYTGFKYSHISIALKKDIDNMYSFGRKKYNNPFNGGFIIENKNSRFYKKFNKTTCTILELEVSNVSYKKLVKLLNHYKDNIDIYKYDFLGIIFSIFNITYKRNNYSVCSEFVGRLLEESSIYYFNKKRIKPIDFLNIPNIKKIYEGLLLDY